MKDNNEKMAPKKGTSEDARNDRKDDDYESQILKFWIDNDIFNKLKEHNAKGKPYYFLQGPPYTSGKIHLGQAWNNTMKDFIIRYKKMNGFDVWNRAGYDMHGLPTERKVQAELKLESKQDIVGYGLEKFSEKCYEWSEEKAEWMNDDLLHLGVDMDFKNAYMPIKQEYIEGIWWLIKETHKKKRLYEGLRTTSWCASCSTALAKHEQEYKELEDTSIYVKFPIKGKHNEFLLIWTTTPWTISYNLGVMINPEFEYVKVKVESENNHHNGNLWIVAKELMNKVEFHTNTKLTIVEEFKGIDIDGLEYEHFWKEDIPELKKIKEESERAFTVLMTKEYCTLDAGTGLVHCAPGCGPEDYEVGYGYKIPPFNSIGEDGSFPKEMGRFAGLHAKRDDKIFIKEMDNDHVLAGKQSYVHDYAHCERCHNPVVFKTTKQWFFKTEDLKDRMLELNRNIYWNPQTAKNAFNSWLENLRDNSITKQRFWGTPVPIWICDKCGKYIVVESVEELKKFGAINLPTNNLEMHKPFIDRVTLPCHADNHEHCSGTMHRIPDILDVWIDAGTASWNCLDYPKRKDLFDKYFPADFIMEGKDQIRGWFNLLMVAGILGFDKETFKNVYMHGFITDVDGQKMSKSLGNIIKPKEITDKYGADTLRCYMSSTTAGDDVAFSWDEAELRFRNLKILWNIKNFMLTYSKEIDAKAREIKSLDELGDDSLAERYILSRLHDTMKQVTEMYEKYEIDKISDTIIEMFLEVSRTYIKLVRDKSSLGTQKEKEEVLNTIYTCTMNIVKIFCPVAPFISEKIYQDLKEISANHLEESVYFERWPKHNENMISVEMNRDMKNVQNIIQVILAARDKSKIGVRWPLPKVIIQINEDDKDENNPEKIDVKKEIEETLSNFESLIREQTNIKEIMIGKLNLKFKVKPNYKTIGKEFGQVTADILTGMKGKEEEIASILEKGKNYEMNVSSGKIELTKEHFEIEVESIGNQTISEIKGMIVGLDTTQTDDLVKEGFAREITRRIQQERKNLGLNKKDVVNINIECSDFVSDAVTKFHDMIYAKVGADRISVNKRLENANISEHSIKDENLKIEIVIC